MGATGAALLHMGAALKLCEAASIGSIPQRVGQAIRWAVADAIRERDVSIKALDEALRLLDDNASHGLRRPKENKAPSKSSSARE